MYYILDENKKVIKVELSKWANWLEKPENKIVKQEILWNKRWVSTVFLGLDHSFGSNKLLIFETMVFPKRGNFRELDMNRYSTWREAERGHKKMVNKWRVFWLWFLCDRINFLLKKIIYRR